MQHTFQSILGGIVSNSLAGAVDIDINGTEYKGSYEIVEISDYEKSSGVVSKAKIILPADTLNFENGTRAKVYGKRGFFNEAPGSLILENYFFLVQE